MQKDYTPQELATKRRQLAQEYNLKMTELGELKKKRAIAILEFIKSGEAKTASMATLIYEASENGQKELELAFYLKGLIELMRAVKTEFESKQGESFNQY